MTEPAYRLDWRALRAVCPTLAPERAKEVAYRLGQAMREHRPEEHYWNEETACHFISQCALESGEFRYTREIWGPTSVQSGYWRRRADLGNYLPWHGKAYRGGGYIQTTGLRNWKSAARQLKVSLRFLRKHADEHKYAAIMAMLWWRRAFPHRINKRSVKEVTLVVNGGLNGYEERLRYFNRAATVAEGLVPKRREKG